MAKLSPSERTLDLTGEARSYESATLYSKVSGYLKSITVQRGSHVKAGQMIAVIESPETDRDYQGAVADLKNKLTKLERTRGLVEKNLVSQQDLEQAQADADIAQARLNVLKTQMEYQIIRAPFAGTVTARFADPGALVQSAANSQTSALPLVTLSTTGKLRVFIYLDQKDAAFVHAGDSVTLWTSERPGNKIHATITRFNGELDPKTRMMLAEVELNNQAELLVPGSFVQARLKINAVQICEIPSEALVIQKEKTLVAVVSQNNLVNYREVHVADNDGFTAQVVEGLNPGERVALNLGSNVEEGGRVQPVAAPTPAATKKP